MNYDLYRDIRFVQEALGYSSAELCDRMGVSRSYVASLENEGSLPPRLIEAFYSFAYASHFRLNLAHEEILSEENKAKVLFHGSSLGLKEISAGGSRQNCDFGPAFYLGETYEQAASFISDSPEGSVYAFSFDHQGLEAMEFDTDLDWMILVCYYRGRLRSYGEHPKMKAMLEKVKDVDYLIAPIANNRMFRVMKDFDTGAITSVEASHALAASGLGKQYVLKTEKAIARLKPLCRLYLCEQEKSHYQELLLERSHEVSTKLMLSKRQFRGQGLYIDEVFP